MSSATLLRFECLCYNTLESTEIRRPQHSDTVVRLLGFLSRSPESLELVAKNSDSFDGFKRFLKTILFSRYYCDWRNKGLINEMRYINLHFTILSLCMSMSVLNDVHHECRRRRVDWFFVMIVHGPAYLDTCPSSLAVAADAHLYWRRPRYCCWRSLHR